MKTMVACSLGAVLLLLSACAESDKFEDREARIEAALEDNRNVSVLGSEAVWLVKTSSLAANDRTAVFFEYGDNYAACVEFAEAYEAQYEDEYHCEGLR